MYEMTIDDAHEKILDFSKTVPMVRSFDEKGVLHGAAQRF